MNSKSLLIERIYSLELTQRATLVAFYLINRADSEGTCFPGVKTIAKECNISTRTVQRALNDLEKAGFITRESRFHEQGGQRSNLYHLIEVESTNDIDSLDSKIGGEVFEIKDVSCDKEQSTITVNSVEQRIVDNEKMPINNRLEQVYFNSYFSTNPNENELSGPLCQDGVP